MDRRSCYLISAAVSTQLDPRSFFVHDGLTVYLPAHDALVLGVMCGTGPRGPFRRDDGHPRAVATPFGGSFRGVDVTVGLVLDRAGEQRRRQRHQVGSVKIEHSLFLGSCLGSHGT